ncbi:CUB domain-containing protein [Winogradskyella sp.]|uniref:CUB domain-containing protein n=1 Tax=Winogradskyella sp. TaxID=1883156 RepID=UPI0025F8E2B3|nr:CUB domain-containing protein [Winogradskyella sp.]
MIKKLLFLLIIFTTCIKGFSQDDPCNAIPLPLSAFGSCTYAIGDNTGATDSDLTNPNIDAPTGCDPVSANYNGADVWFYIDLGPTTTSIQIDLTHIGTSNFDDGVAALYTGTCGGTLTIVECDDDSGSGTLEANFSVLNGLTPSTRVYIRVWEWGGFDEGTFNICASEVEDPCNSITNIPVCGTTPINSTIASGFGAINDSTCIDVPGDEAVFSFTPTVTGNYTITQISTFDHINYLYQTSCAVTGWTCIDDLIGNNETSGSFNMIAGTTYYIMLDSENSNGGNVSFTLNCPLPPPECGDIFYDSGGVSGNYSDNELETTTIFPDTPGDAVTATFTLFDLEFADDLYIYDGPTAASPLIGVFNGTGIPGPFTSSDPTGALTFVFDSDSSVVYSGWAANLTCAPYVPPTICGSTFTDSGGAGSNYSDGENTTTTLTPDIPNTFLAANFTAFETENTYDFLYIYDGPNNTFPLIGTYTGTNSPGNVTSTHPSGALTFVFTSDGSSTDSGWIADITCITVAPTCGDMFYDSGGATGNYGPNENETTIITPITAGDAVTTTFTAFNLAAGDFLEVFDGATSLGQFSGTTLPGPFTATNPSGELTFVFTSNGSGTQSGWAANITCSILCNLNITDTVYPIGANTCTSDYSELIATTAGIPGGTTTISPFPENFDNAGLPTGWTIDNGIGGGVWSINNSSNAGGTPYEATLSGGFSTTANGNRTLTSPAININGQTNLQLNLEQYLNHYSSSYLYTISIQTNLDGTGWVNQYVVNNVANNIGPETRTIDLSSLSGNSLQIRFLLNGFPFGLNYWYIDDIILTGETPAVTPTITWSPQIGLYTDPGLTTAYMGENLATVYAAPDGFETYTATDQNSCDNTIDVQHSKKVWNGSIDDDWMNPLNWSDDTFPDATDCVIIPNTTNNPVIYGNDSGDGLNLTIEAGATLTLDDNNTDTDYAGLIIQDFIDIQNSGVLHIQNNSSLVQINEIGINVNNNIGTGTLIMDRVPFVSNTDYVYWSSPVSNMSLSNIYGLDTPNATYQWRPTIPNGTFTLPPGPCTPNIIPFCHGDWEVYSGNMDIGKGYISSGPTSQGATPSDYTTSVYGSLPNNGIITHIIESGTNLSTNCDFTHLVNGNSITVTPFDDNWNLIGNPYPSAISANAFIGYSSSGVDNSSIEGAIHIWTHGTDANGVNPDPFYDDYVLNYNPNDYLTYNLSGPNTYPNEIVATDYFIGAGQGFFVLADFDNGSNNVTFSNSMRNIIHDNTNFYRNSSNENTETTNTIERHRIWLNLSNESEQTSSTMVGYIEGASQSKDRTFDAYTFESNTMSIYSMIEDERMVIQGRQLPFDVNDQVPLGLDILEEGNYTISISGVDGLFEDNNSQDIYLEDTHEGIIHDLRSSPYTFNSDIGKFKDRFILRYTNNSLNIKSYDSTIGIKIFEENEKIVIKSDYANIQSIEVYDILGRTLFFNKSVNINRFIINSLQPKDTALFLKIKLVDGKQKIAKVIF